MPPAIYQGRLQEAGAWASNATHMHVRHCLVPSLLAAAALAAPARANHYGLRLGVGVRTAAEVEAAADLARGDGFTVRVPFGWDDPPEAFAQRAEAVEAGLRRGWRVVASLRYRPPETMPSVSAPSGFEAWVASVVAALRGQGPVVFEVTNRPNSPFRDPDADSGPDPAEALVRGVLAAHREAPESEVGFSWLATGSQGGDVAWWAALGTRAPRELAQAVDFVGAQLYPGTYGASRPWVGGGPGRTAVEELTALRQLYLPAAGLGGVPIDVGEAGFGVVARPLPVYGGWPDAEAALRSEAAQAQTLQALVPAMRDAAERLGVRRLVWWSLADGPTCPLQLCFGLVDGEGRRRDAYYAFVREAVTLAS